MTARLYGALATIGYHHPLHPILVHLTIGLVLGGFIFRLAAGFAKRAELDRTAAHCFTLALISAVPTALLGYMDWQHFYGGAWLFPFKAKIVLAIVLVVLLAVAVRLAAPSGRKMRGNVLVYLLCVLTVAGLGYFGGEIVFGRISPTGPKKAAAVPVSASVHRGQVLFAQLCAGCHYADRTDTKVGPGLAGLSKRKILPISNWPNTDANLRRQIRTPFAKMPAFKKLTDTQVDELVAYLKTL